MVRVIAFVFGIAAGVALLLFVISALSLSAQPPIRTSRAITLDVQPGAPTFAHPTDPSDMPSLGDDAADPDDGAQVDLQGDEVTPAVATYKFDAQGNIYETHAPHTEVPKLSSPSM